MTLRIYAIALSALVINCVANAEPEFGSPPDNTSVNPPSEPLIEPEAVGSSVSSARLKSFDSVEAILERAVQAARGLNYKGTFTYEYGSVLETLELVHVVSQGVEHERVLHLSGEKREFLRSGRRSECESLASSLLKGESLLSQSGVQLLSDHYQFLISGDQRIAGRPATVVKFQPKDDLRLGRVMAFDKLTGLPLLVVSLHGKHYLERFQFVHLQSGDEVGLDALRPDVGPVVVLNSPNLCAAEQLEAASDSQAISLVAGDGARGPTWRANWLPRGFVLSQSSPEVGFTDVLTYSDGLSAFTLFVMDLDGTGVDGFKNGVARFGASLSVTQAVEVKGERYGLAIVGDVPPVSARRILASVSPIL